MFESWLHRLIDATSQWLNVLIFNGDPNHSISGDAYRLNRPRLERFIDTLFALIEDHHCYKSYRADVYRAHCLVQEHLDKYPEDAEKLKWKGL